MASSVLQHNLHLAYTQLALKDYEGDLKSAQAALAIDPAQAIPKLHETQALKAMQA